MTDGARSVWRARNPTQTVLALDVGTTGVTAVLIGTDGSVRARGYAEFPQYFPEPGWVEHDPEEIWRALQQASRRVLIKGREDGLATPSALGIANQRETAVLWDRKTLRAPRRAIVWQDRRTAGVCAEFRGAGHEDRVRKLTGLRLDPYFTATKLRWIARERPDIWDEVTSGRMVVGTVDSYVIARLTSGRHVTDPSNASRTLLYDTFAGGWSEELCDLFGVPPAALPEIVPSSGVVGTTDPDAFLGLRLPVAGIAGDQQAALFGQACFEVGSSKCTFSEGAFVLANTGRTPVRSDAGLLTTVAWDLGDGLVYALEGSVYIAGAAVQWLKDGLRMIESEPEIESAALEVPDSGGVVFVPALTGLGAPHWDPEARGMIIGLTRGSTRAHLARATLDAMTFQVRDVADIMVGEAKVAIPALSVDGSASANNLLCQLQADQLGVPVRRPVVQGTAKLGAAFLAGLATGVWANTAELAATWQLDREFTPIAGARYGAAYRRWGRAVERSRGWGSGA